MSQADDDMSNRLGGVVAVLIVIAFIVMGIFKVLTWLWLNLLAPCLLEPCFTRSPFLVASGVMGGLWFAREPLYAGGERRGLPAFGRRHPPLRAFDSRRDWFSQRHPVGLGSGASAKSQGAPAKDQVHPQGAGGD